MPIPRLTGSNLHAETQHGDCIRLMQRLPDGSVDMVLTDPPYIVRYKSRDGRSIANDDNDRWVAPAFAEIYRVLKDGSFCISFYGWNSIDVFMAAWKSAGFRVVGHIVFRKRYASSRRYLAHQHEQAFLLAKGNAALPETVLPDVLDWIYTGNKLHPTQKPVAVLEPLVRAFAPDGGLVLDPFAGSGSSLLAARNAGRRFLGMELDYCHYLTARRTLALVDAMPAARLSAGLKRLA